MRIAVLHYHVRPGGVTRVIQHTIRALSEAGHEVVVVSATPAGDMALEAPVLVWPELAYGCEPSDENPDRLFSEWCRTLEQKVGHIDLWHIHNHSLGKNTTLPLWVQWLAENGRPCVLQLHDFAEDNRPLNYTYTRNHLPNLGRLYPHADHVHYALLNNRDFNFMKKAGIPADRLHVLPNPAVSPDCRPSASTGSLILYPTRAIRRKNIGEFILWSVLDDDHEYAITLAPENPAERKYYDDWVAYAQARGLSVMFEYGQQNTLTFDDMMMSSCALATTSIAEGFGLAYLEPWLYDRPLFGRNLPDVTADFAANGLDLNHLYHSVPVQKACIAEVEPDEVIREAYAAQLAVYGLIPDRVARDTLEQVLAGPTLDFGCLNEAMQRNVIDQVISGRPVLGDQNQTLMQADLPSELIESNRAVIEADYDLEQYARHLIKLYEGVDRQAAATVDYADGDELLRCFLNPEKFTLLRS